MAFLIFSCNNLWRFICWSANEECTSRCSYDAEGNLARKIEPNGDVWEYEYFGNGMLSKAVRPDGTEVTFKYDSLGRRIEKQTPENTKHFVWNGNTPLHEWEDDDIITWVFNDGFVPTSDDILGVFHSLYELGKTVIIVTHDKSVAAHCNRHIEIHDGKIIADS